MISYGFDTTYWYTSTVTHTATAWLDVSLATRFMAVDLPRNVKGDTLTIWTMADVGGTDATTVKNDVTLASAANLAIAASACLLLSSSLI
jgi:hypothetical protein